MSTIVAISTPPGAGGIAVIRLSGADALAIADRAWRGARLADAASHSAHLGRITFADGSTLDTAVATIFRGPNSFTGEDTVEFSVHGSRWIQRRLIERLVELGAQPAGPGEFTQRAFINGRMDLAQAEAVADIIASSSRAAHKLAMSQMNGRFSRRLDQLRQELVDLASLLELELDFSEEDVEFADRQRLDELTGEILTQINRLADTYDAGRAFKEGVPVAIAGVPNAGKSTLLNSLLDEDKAIVSDIPGTTRDIIEDTREIDGVLFRFIDTAGLRDTVDTVERIGIERATAALGRAAIILWLIDPTQPVAPQTERMRRYAHRYPDAKIIRIDTKADLNRNETESADATEAAAPVADDEAAAAAYQTQDGTQNRGEKVALKISACTGEGTEALKRLLTQMATTDHNPDAELIITNARHHAALQAGASALRRARAAMADSLPPDLIAQDIREAIHHLAALTGQITTSDLLTTVFSRFCIGK